MNNYRHITRLVVVIAVVGAVLLVVRASLVPSTFGQYGAYVGASVDEISNKPVQYVGAERGEEKPQMDPGQTGHGSSHRAGEQTSASGPAAPSTANAKTPRITGKTTSRDTDGSGHRVLELTRGLDGFRMPCADCHRHLGPSTKDPTRRGQGPHKHVVLDHGENNRCFNCHHPSSDQYGSFAAHDGSVIPVGTVEQLCGKCHGPHYRAWKRGAHGQRSGYWDLSLGPQTTAHCNECHDPHRPYFKPPPTLPGPRTLHGELSPDHPCRTKLSHGTQAE